MVYDFAKAIEKIGEAIKSGFSYAEKAKEHQSETAIIKENARLQDAVNTAEKIFKMTDICCQNCDFFENKKKYKKLRELFDKKD